MKNYKAIVIGATGGVGAYLVEKLVNSTQCAELTVISRKASPKAPKLTNIIWDDFSEHLINKSEKDNAIFKNHDVFFCCLGAPEKAMLGLVFNKKKYAKLFQKIDYDYVVGAAHIAKAAGIPNFSVISSPSAKQDAKFEYSKIKWRMEQAIQSIGFEKVSFIHPYHLMKPAKNQETFFSKVTGNVGAFITKLIPANQKAIKVEDVASAMMLEFESRPEEEIGVNYYTSDAMREIINNHNFK